MAGGGRLLSPRARLLLLLPFTGLLAVFFAAPLALMAAVSVARPSFGQFEWTFTLHHYISPRARTEAMHEHPAH